MFGPQLEQSDVGFSIGTFSLFNSQLSDVTRSVFTTWKVSVSVCALIFPLTKKSPCYLGGQPRHGAPALIHTHTARCVGVTQGTDGLEQRQDPLRHFCRETQVTGVCFTREKPGLVPT